jgi:hypothetical protein
VQHGLSGLPSLKGDGRRRARLASQPHLVVTWQKYFGRGMYAGPHPRQHRLIAVEVRLSQGYKFSTYATW